MVSDTYFISYFKRCSKSPFTMKIKRCTFRTEISLSAGKKISLKPIIEPNYTPRYDWLYFLLKIRRKGQDTRNNLLYTIWTRRCAKMVSCKHREYQVACNNKKISTTSLTNFSPISAQRLISASEESKKIRMKRS